MTYVPANLRRNAGFDFPEVQTFPRARKAGIAGLTPRDQRRLRDGVQHAVACGPRWVGELLLQVARDSLDQEELLATLDKSRNWPPEVVRAFDGNRFPRMALNEVALLSGWQRAGRLASMLAAPATRRPLPYRAKAFRAPGYRVEPMR